MMITRERIKEEIDKVPDIYLDVIFHIVQSFKYAPLIQTPSKNVMKEWQAFVDNTYGILASDPIERGTQGKYEVREAII